MLDGVVLLPLVLYNYSPKLARFLSQDPIGFDAGDWNLFRYAGNLVTVLADPTGLAIEPCTDPERQQCGRDCRAATLSGEYYHGLVTCFWVTGTICGIAYRIRQCACKYRTCTAIELHNLQTTVNNLCGNLPPSCDENTDPTEAAARAKQFQACADARRDLNNKCFKGGDFIHQTKMRLAEGNATLCRIQSQP